MFNWKEKENLVWNLVWNFCNVNGYTDRESGASRHHRDPFRAPPETPRTSLQYCTERLKGGL